MANVIQFPAPKSNLELRELVGSNGKGVITDWLKSGVRARMKVRVQYLRKFPRAEWTMKQFRSLGDGLYELKWEAGKVQCRALGFDQNSYFLMLLGCTHKDNVYDPKGCIETAKRIKGGG